MNIEKIQNICNDADVYRKKTINLIASENINLGRTQLKKEYFTERYAEGNPYKRYYNGTNYIDELEINCKEYFENKLKCFVNIQPTSGTVANLATFAALKDKSGVIITNSLAAGGHISHNKMGGSQRIVGLNVINFKYNKDSYNINFKDTSSLIQQYQPDFLIFGRSMYVNYDDELKVMKKIKKQFPNIKIIFDAAHVFGLIYQGAIKNPLDYGADVMTSSTHKTFPGPQGGIILTKNKKLMKKINGFVFPGCVSNHHLHRIPELYITAILLDNVYLNYSKYIKYATKIMSKEFKKYGFNIISDNTTHQIIIDLSTYGNIQNIVDKLQNNNIIVNKNALIYDTSVINPSGIRIGVQEMVLRYMMNHDSFSDFSMVIDKNFKEIVKKIYNIIRR